MSARDGRQNRFETSLADHDQVLKYFHIDGGGWSNVTVTLPGALGLSHGFQRKWQKFIGV